MDGFRAAVLLLACAVAPVFPTGARLDAALAIPISAPGGSETRGTKEKPPPADLLPAGRSFTGTWFAERPCEVLVLERDQAAETAVLRLTTEKNAFYRITIETNDDGSRFEITDIRNTRPPPSEPVRIIDFQSGSGKVSSKGALSMKWRAKKLLGRGRVSWNTEVKAS